jgi:hypothetical protein
MKTRDKKLWTVSPKMVEAITEYLRRQVDDEYLGRICREYQAKFKLWSGYLSDYPMSKEELGEEVQPCCILFWLCPRRRILNLLPLKAHLRSLKHVAATMGVDPHLLKQTAESLRQPDGPRISAIRNKDMRTCMACHLLDDCGDSCRCRCARSTFREMTGHWLSYSGFLFVDLPLACPHRGRHQAIQRATKKAA